MDSEYRLNAAIRTALHCAVPPHWYTVISLLIDPHG
jgi:hypothetical protein